MNYVYGVPNGFQRVWTSEAPTITLSELQPQTKGDGPVATYRGNDMAESSGWTETTYTPQRYSDARAKEIADNIVWWASVCDNIRWLNEYTEIRNAQGPTAAEFSTLVEAEIAKGLTEVEALHSVAAAYPEFYDAYRDAIFLDGKLPAPNVN